MAVSPAAIYVLYPRMVRRAARTSSSAPARRVLGVSGPGRPKLIRSTLCANLLSVEWCASHNKDRFNLMQIYTIGHSNHTQGHFLDLLTGAGVQVLVDVRSNPNSRWATFANGDNLKEILESVLIRYIYLGDALGGRPSDSDSYDDETHKADYQAIRKKEYFRHGIKRLLAVLGGYRVCIMCAEEDPTSCHRNLLIAEDLRQAGVEVFHIRGDGRIQTDEELWKERVGVAVNQRPLPL
jgi:hypothetical protein